MRARLAISRPLRRRRSTSARLPICCAPRATLAQIEAAERRQRYLESRGTFMRTADVDGRLGQELEEVIAVIDAGLVDLADALGSRERCLPIIRRWWRAAAVERSRPAAREGES